MFVLCVMYSKDNRQKPEQSGQRSTDKYKEREREREKIPSLSVVSVVCRQIEVSATGRSLSTEVIPTVCKLEK